jgi:hypothetical protein
MTTGIKEESGEKLYTFRGKTFYCDARTIQKLNYALALNQSCERYEKAK